MLSSKRGIILQPKKVPYSVTNAVTNGNFANDITGWTQYHCPTYEIVGDTCKITGDGLDAYPNIYQMLASTVGHKWFYRVKVMLDNSTAVRAAMRSEGAEVPAPGYVDTPTEGVWYTLYCVKTAGATSISYAVSERYANAGASNGKILSVREAFAVNLTTVFGAGKEIVDPARCNRAFPNWFNGTQVVFI